MPIDEKSIKSLIAVGSGLVKGPFCGQLKYNYPTRGTINFKKEIFNNQPDFVRTAEWL